MILQNLSLYVRPGQKIAFVGSTGAGKTTITNLINRFYEVSGGSITYDGMDVRLIKKDDLRRSLGVVLQGYTFWPARWRTISASASWTATAEEIGAGARICQRGLPSSAACRRLQHDGDRRRCKPEPGQRQLLAIARRRGRPASADSGRSYVQY